MPKLPVAPALSATLLAAALAMALPATAEPYLPTAFQSAILKTLSDNHSIMSTSVRAEVLKLLADAEAAAKSGKQQEADGLVGKAMMIVGEELYRQAPRAGG
ncbi:MAG TPA: hypothetical protein VEB20_12245 [Azospirillaceae bacterium]|nr:hypothetical protein [Azospirillaceae bacterium]